MRKQTIQTIAVVDDEAEIAKLLAEMAYGQGFAADTFQCADKLLAARKDKHYAVTVLDLSLPDMDGFEVLRALGEQLCHAQAVEPLVLISGHDRSVLSAARRRAEKLGLRILGSLTKPVRAPEFAHMLASITASPATPDSRVLVSAADLQRGIDNDEMLAFVQPQVSLRTGEWVGLEALVRWKHPQFGLLTPDRFVPLAESTGLALALTRAVILQALGIAQRARDQQGFSGTLAINLAPVSLTDPHFPEAMARLVQEVPWDPARLCFEVTETSVAADPDLALEILARLHMRGFRLSLDDFGTGHSTLENLSLMPVSELKVDMNFVRPGLQDRTARVITEQSIALGRELGMRVVAEGVETLSHWQWLRKAGCDNAQGYFISRAIPGHLLRGWSENWSLTGSPVYAGGGARHALS